MTTSDDALTRITRQFDECLDLGRPLDAALHDLLRTAGGRAVGLWQVAGKRLKLMGFCAADDMSTTVREEFVSATREAELSEKSLGIVKAAVSKTPAVASLEANDSGLSGSAGWLKRFGARRSLAVPIFDGQHVGGVLAISTIGDVSAESFTAQLLTGLTAHLSRRTWPRKFGTVR